MSTLMSNSCRRMGEGRFLSCINNSFVSYRNLLGRGGRAGVEEEGQRLVQQVGEDRVHQGGEHILQLGYEEEQQKESYQV